MTADPQLPAITCPTSMIASCAPLLGFTPRGCVVAFVSGVPGRAGAVLVRCDLPATGAGQIAEGLSRSIRGTGGAVVDLVAWIEDDDDTPRSRLSSAATLDLLAARLEEAGLQVATCLSTNGRVWWSHACPDELCCGDAQPLDRGVLTSVQAEYVYAGYAPMSDRAEIARRIAPEPARTREVRRLLRRSAPPRDVERWRDRQVILLSELLVPDAGRGVAGEGRGRVAGVLTASQVACVLRGLADVRVRDTVLHRLVLAEPDQCGGWEATLDRLCEVVRAAPVGTAAPPATLLALAAWMRGSGALASIALDRAADDDPGYRLALLAREVIARGVDPRMWRASMGSLSEDECRAGGAAGQ